MVRCDAVHMTDLATLHALGSMLSSLMGSPSPAWVSPAWVSPAWVSPAWVRNVVSHMGDLRLGSMIIESPSTVIS